MNRTIHTLAIATLAALAAPTVCAQSGDTTQVRQATATNQATQTGAVVRESLLTTNAPVGEQLDQRTPPPVAGAEEEEEAMRRDRRRALKLNLKPPRAAAASAAAQRGAWSELDADGDGRVSLAEGEVNADFKSSFEMMDADHDGFVSDVEYRAHARANATRGRDDAVRHDPTLRSGVGDTSRDPEAVRTDDDE
ncbi:hypothetical protein ACFFGH_02810 [Lysobacter korlensis]|uniref:EF-hand domain-containing protein n=1 Tax=Lysobacter korlensis TaxID=553636 RepID=A0ABV6RIG9_9GAMM